MSDKEKTIEDIHKEYVEWALGLLKCRLDLKPEYYDEHHHGNYTYECCAESLWYKIKDTIEELLWYKEKNQELEDRVDKLYEALAKAYPIEDEPWCEGWTSPADCNTCSMIECNCNPRNKCNKPAQELTMYNANAFKVKLEDGTDAYVEEQEHCSLISIGNSEGFICGQYCFLRDGSAEFEFDIWDEEYPIKEYNCKILAYSHDYGKTWEEIKYE